MATFNYKTKKNFLALLCYSDLEFNKLEAVDIIKTFGSSLNVSSITAGKTFEIKEASEEKPAEINVNLDGFKIFDLCYKLPTKSFLATGYVDNKPEQATYNGKGVYSLEDPDNDKLMAVFIEIGKKEGVLKYGE